MTRYLHSGGACLDLRRLCAEPRGEFYLASDSSSLNWYFPLPIFLRSCINGQDRHMGMSVFKPANPTNSSRNCATISVNNGLLYREWQRFIWSTTNGLIHMHTCAKMGPHNRGPDNNPSANLYHNHFQILQTSSSPHGTSALPYCSTRCCISTTVWTGRTHTSDTDMIAIYIYLCSYSPYFWVVSLPGSHQRPVGIILMWYLGSIK